ncbi:MAG: DNA translocase FtsK 4TM domain-containing protein, partial [Gammaproteobacteria bacterium]|nr:DNA translocase FtsK 4TM domain-containing protein [Gammaproteobacteria bacterium]
MASKQASQKVTSESQVSHKLNHSLREVGLILIGTIAIFLLLALYSFHPLDPGWSHSGNRSEIFNFGGQTGAWLADLLLYLFGLMAYLLPMLVGYFAWLTYRDKSFVQGEHQVVPTMIKVGGFLLLMLTGSGLAHLHFVAGPGLLPESNHPGGVLGHMVSEQGFALLFGGLGATLLLLALFMTSI